METQQTALYLNPWYKPGGTDPQIYRTSAPGISVGKYTRYYRIQSSNPSARCYDYVLNGVCVTQRCGQVDESFLDAYMQDSASPKVLAALTCSLSA